MTDHKDEILITWCDKHGTIADLWHEQNAAPCCDFNKDDCDTRPALVVPDHLTICVEQPEKTDDEQLCAERLAVCLCTLRDDGHEAHVCACGGSWVGSDADFDVITFPQWHVGLDGNRVVEVSDDS